jgi:hypothetical protein
MPRIGRIFLPDQPNAGANIASCSAPRSIRNS